MPTISRFHGIVIRMFFDDHSFPHFHAEAAGLKAKIRIDRIEVIESNLPRKATQDGLPVGNASPTRTGKELAAGARRWHPGEDRAMEMIGIQREVVTSVCMVRHGVVVLTFADGLEGEVDLLDRLRGPVFERARTPEGFAEVFLNEEAGTITWPGEVDFAPDTLYQRVRTGMWPQDLPPAD